ncbi:MAG: dTDP-4-dehydrorhamnose 3,5-epimerase family protein [Candidatus Competibacteraceae bacterium]
MGHITAEQLMNLAEPLVKDGYGQYLLELLQKSLSMNVIATELPGVLILEPRVFGDHRGFFLETYHRARYQHAGIAETFVQDNPLGRDEVCCVACTLSTGTTARQVGCGYPRCGIRCGG